MQMRTIWLSALQDILTIKNLPRLQSAIPCMSLEAIIRTTIRLARQDRDFGHPDRAPCLIRDMTRIPFAEHTEAPCLALLPGGRHVALLDPSRRRLMVHAVDAETTVGELLVPPFEHNCTTFRVAAYSPDEVLVAVHLRKEK